MEASLSQQIDIVQKMRGLAVQANSGLLSESQRTNIQNEMLTYLDEFNRITSETEFNGLKPQQNSEDNLAILSVFGTEALEFGWDSSTANDIFKREVGNGVFNPTGTRSNTSSFNAASMSSGDINGDGILDLVLPGWSNSTISYYLGAGNGSFGPEMTIAGPYANAVTVADFNGDGRDDVAGVDNNNGDLYIHFAGADGRLQSATTVAGLSTPYVVANGDVDQDGDLDLMTHDSISSSLALYLNDGEGRFFLGSTVSVLGSVQDVKVIDLDQDGFNDIVSSSGDQISIHAYYGRGDGSFNSVQCYTGSVGGGYAFDIADVNGDGLLDILRGSGASLQLYLGTGARTFATATTIATTGTVASVHAKDIDNDGTKDIVIGSYTESLSYMLGYGNGSFQAEQTIASTVGGIVVGDFDGDGISEIASRTSGSQISFYKQGSKDRLSLDLFTDTSETGSRYLIEMLDQALEKLTERLTAASLSFGRIDREVDRASLLKSLRSEQIESIESVDYALEMSQLVRNQILQQAQVAALSQSNLQMQMVLNLLNIR
jgi:flagellin-like hook-associated protein FlgL